MALRQSVMGRVHSNHPTVEKVHRNGLSGRASREDLQVQHKDIKNGFQVIIRM